MSADLLFGALSIWIFVVGLVVGMGAVLGSQRLSRRLKRVRGTETPGTQHEPPLALAGPSEDQATKGSVDSQLVQEIPTAEPVEHFVPPVIRFGLPYQIFYDPSDWEEPLLCNGAENCPGPEMTKGQVIWLIPVADGRELEMPWCLDCIADLPVGADRDALLSDPQPQAVEA